jgi:hypothetical protein
MKFWAVCAERLSGEIELIDKTHDELDASAYKKEMHVAPCVFRGDELSFGPHEFTRDCPCHPDIMRREDHLDWLIIKHHDRTN